MPVSRNEQVELINTDKLKSAYSFDVLEQIRKPKGTVTWSPGAGPAHWLPSASFSIGQAFFTQDPRINVAPSATGTGASALANPLEHAHALQLAIDKEFFAK